MSWTSRALCILLGLFAPTAQATTFCNTLQLLMDADPPVAFRLGDYEVNCTGSLELGGLKSTDCGWGFPYRSDAADAAFLGLLDDVATCGTLVNTADPDVSHPDSYDLREFEMDGGRVRVALKDKATLQQTYVFLRISTGSL